MPADHRMVDTPLFDAVCSGDARAVQTLIDKRVDYEQCDTVRPRVHTHMTPCPSSTWGSSATCKRAMFLATGADRLHFNTRQQRP